MDDDGGGTTHPWERGRAPNGDEEDEAPGLEDVLKANLQGELHQSQLEPGLVIDGKWELTRLLGAGGFGRVYEAWHIQLDRPVAIKFLDTRHRVPRSRQRFLEEARLMASMASEHLVRASDYGELPDGTPYFVMDLVNGRTLRAHMRERLPVLRVVEILDGVLQGLSTMHARGVVHADVKPENIIIGDDDGKVRLLDFGLARASEPGDGDGGGTPPYMAPEMLFDGTTACERTDVYAVGVLSYEMLTGRLPRGHGGMGFEQMRRSWESRPNAHPVRVQRPVPRLLDDFVASALSHDPVQRPESSQSMLEDLRRIVPRIARGDLASALRRERRQAWSTGSSEKKGGLLGKWWWATPVAVFMTLLIWIGSQSDQEGPEESESVPGLGVAGAMGKIVHEDESPSVPRYVPDQRARSRGTPSDGSLENGIQIPDVPKLYLRRHPPNMWASGYTIAKLQLAIVYFRRIASYEGPLIVSDASRKGGGSFRPRHQSHRSGRDVDLWLPLLPGRFMQKHLVQGPRPEEVDWKATWGLLKALISTGAVQMILLAEDGQNQVREAALSLGAQEDEIAALLRDVPGGNPDGLVSDSIFLEDEGGMHVRFRCASYEDQCFDERDDEARESSVPR